jgi:predicted transcriptional regulator
MQLIHSTLPNIQVKYIMSAEFPQIEETTPLEPVTYLLQYSPAVLTTRKGKVVGIITKADLFKLIIR